MEDGWNGSRHRSGSRRSGNPPEWKSQKASQKRNAKGVELDERTLEVKDCGSEEEVTCPQSGWRGRAQSADWKMEAKSPVHGAEGEAVCSEVIGSHGRRRGVVQWGTEVRTCMGRSILRSDWSLSVSDCDTPYIYIAS